MHPVDLDLIIEQAVEGTPEDSSRFLALRCFDEIPAAGGLVNRFHGYSVKPASKPHLTQIQPRAFGDETPEAYEMSPRRSIIRALEASLPALVTR